MSTTTTIGRCVYCGSTEVFHDARVNANDPADVRVYEATQCDGCFADKTRVVHTNTDHWVICEPKDDEDRFQWLFWSNDNGWGDYESATRFTEDERQTLTLPLGGEWLHMTED
jgi:hypothetical protein